MQHNECLSRSYRFVYLDSSQELGASLLSEGFLEGTCKLVIKFLEALCNYSNFILCK